MIQDPKGVCVWVWWGGGGGHHDIEVAVEALEMQLRYPIRLSQCLVYLPLVGRPTGRASLARLVFKLQRNLR
jgi:hypothetical protein